jgi:hypothetical protein
VARGAHRLLPASRRRAARERPALPRWRGAHHPARWRPGVAQFPRVVRERRAPVPARNPHPAAARALRGRTRNRLHLRARGRGPVPRQHLPANPRHRLGLPHRSQPAADHRGAGPAVRGAKIHAATERFGAGHRSHRVGQDHHHGGHHSRDQQDLEPAHHHHRGSHRVRAHADSKRDHPAASGQARRELRRRPAFQSA